MGIIRGDITMSYDPNSEYVRNRDNRTKINNLLGWGKESDIDFHRCPTCIDHPRLEIVESDGKRMGKCIRGCGNLFNLQKDEERPQNTSRFGSKSHSFIVSKDQKKKSKQTGSLSQLLRRH